MPKISLARWERELRKEAKADDCQLFREHMCDLDLPDEPKLLLAGTVLLVHACCAYASLDGRSYADFLDMQAYDPLESDGAKYLFTFDICGKAFGRVVVPAEPGTIDLADLYGHPWDRYGVCGYYGFWVSCADRGQLSPEESGRIQAEVEADLRYDYSEDELDFSFDDQSLPGVLLVTVSDVEEPEDEGDEEDEGEDEE